MRRPGPTALLLAAALAGCGARTGPLAGFGAVDLGSAEGSGCTAVSANDVRYVGLVQLDGTLAPDLGAGEPDRLLLALRFARDESSPLELDLARQGDLGACTACLLVREDDRDPYGLLQNLRTDTAARFYLATAGTLRLRHFYRHGRSAGTIEGAELVEVTVRDQRAQQDAGTPDWSSTPVPGGRCLALAEVTWDLTVP